MKKAIITGIVLLILGAACFGGAFAIANGDIHQLGVSRFVTETYTAEGDFRSIRIDVTDSDLTFKVAEDGVCRVEFFEREKVRHSVAIEDGTLVIGEKDERAWYEKWDLFSRSPSATIYLPQTAYDALAIDASTGDITIPEAFAFGRIDISLSTGDVNCLASVGGLCKIKTSTGDIRLAGVTVGEVELAVSTGRVTVESVACGEFRSNGSTGDITLKDVIVSGRCAIERSTGDVRFERSDAAEILVKTSTGEVTGTLLSAKVFSASTSTGSVNLPASGAGGNCTITTSTGNIGITIIGG